MWITKSNIIQPRGWCRDTQPHCLHTMNNAQVCIILRWEIFPSSFLPLFFKLTMAPQDSQQLSPQPEVWPPPHIAFMSLIIPSSKYNEMVIFCCLLLFYQHYWPLSNIFEQNTCDRITGSVTAYTLELDLPSTSSLDKW